MMRAGSSAGRADAAELGIDEGKIELGVVGDQRIITDEGKEVVDCRGEDRFFGEEGFRQPMDAIGFRRDRSLGVDVGLIGIAARDMIDELDRTDLDDAVGGRIQAGGLGIENDLTHRQNS